MIFVEKPTYMLPFIFVYKLVIFLLKLPFRLVKYFNIGVFVTITTIINIVISTIYYFFKTIIISIIFVSWCIYRLIRYTILGFITLLKIIGKIFMRLSHVVGLGFEVICYVFYRFLRYTILGGLAPFIYFTHWIKKLIKYNARVRQRRALEAERRAEEAKNKAIAKERNRQIEEENKKRLAEIKAKEKEELKQQKKDKAKADIYINENVTIEKKKFADHLNDLFMAIGKVPRKIKEKFKNNRFTKNSQNKKDINRQALLLDFEGADAEKSAEKVMYKYTAKNPEGKVFTGYFPAYSKVEVHSFLLSEGNEVYSIKTNKWIQQFYGKRLNSSKNKIKTRDLIFFTTQLSTYLKAGITLVEALKILSRQFKNKNYSRIFRSMIYDLTMGDNFSDAMAKQGEAFPRLLINMIKASEMTGELPEALDDMSEYFTETDKTHKQMVTAMMYPSIIFVVAVAAIIFIMVYVVPQFVDIYANMEGATLPGITLFVLNISHFLQEKYLWLILGIALFILIFIYLYKNVKSFKTFVQWLLMHTPVIGDVIIYNEVTMFTKTFASLLAHNVFITDSMEILNKLTNNEVYRMLILDTITNLAKGERISLAFKDHWAFPVPAYEMITTGERTGQLPEMMSKVSAYYQELHRNAVTRIKTFVEPILIIFLTVVVGGIVLSIVIPMFEIYNNIQFPE